VVVDHLLRELLHVLVLGPPGGDLAELDLVHPAARGHGNERVVVERLLVLGPPGGEPGQ